MRRIWNSLKSYCLQHTTDHKDLQDFKISSCVSRLIKKHEQFHYKCILWYFLACIFKNSEHLIYTFVAETDKTII